MCGRYAITTAPEAMRRMFGYPEQPNFPPRYNVAPTQPIPVVVTDGEARRFRLMRWGLIPAWVKDPRKFTLIINARSEGITEKPAFKNAFRRRRCLIPADGYYEWQSLADGKQPLFIHAADGQPFAFAGVFETWAGPDGEEVDTVAIITAAATGQLAALHDRVPVTLDRSDYARWLDCADELALDDVLALLRAPPPGEFVWHPVSRDVNKVANDAPHLTAPLSPEQIAAGAAATPPSDLARDSMSPASFT